MRALMNLVKNKHGVWHAQKRVPPELRKAVAAITGGGKDGQQVFLKKSLGTKDIKAANTRGKLVLAGFDRILQDAAASLTTEKPEARAKLSATEIKRMSEHLFAKVLAQDESVRFGGRAHAKSLVEWVRRNENPNFVLPYDINALPEFGWTSEQLQQQIVHLTEDLASAQTALAQGNLDAIKPHVGELLADFQISLAPSSPAYRELCVYALRSYVRALQAISHRNAGEAVDTPALVPPSILTTAEGASLREALAGWGKERVRPAGTVSEYSRAIEMFTQLHGDLAVSTIRKSHALKFREALQTVPRQRSGKLAHATLPELSHWGAAHPTAPRVSPGTVNKQLGAVQAICGWAQQHGLLPEDAAWADPFHRMRVEEEQSERAPFELKELKTIFRTALFTQREQVNGARGNPHRSHLKLERGKDALKL